MHLFASVRYSLSTSLPENRVNELSYVLDNNGATRADSVEDTHLTHFITNTNSFEHWQDIAAREDAGELVIVTLDAPDLEVLAAGISALGGQWRTGLTKDVTHLFVTKPTSPKYSTAMHFREHTHVKIILPHWFDDALRLGMSGLDTTPYEWPDPPMLRAPNTEESGTAKVEAMKRMALRKIDDEKRSLYRTSDLLVPGARLPTGEDETSASGVSNPRGKVRNVWDSRRVLLGRSLELSGNRRSAVEAEITRAGGQIVAYEAGIDEEVAAVGECDVFVSRFRSGKAYVQAVRQNKTIGTLPWVFHIHSNGTFSSPMDQLLWYPIPKRHIEGFSGHEITVTNYTGEAREYIKRLIITMGAIFTPSMSGKNTVLIAAYIGGIKTDKAASWSIPIVNHLWLEDCFVKWRNLTVALEKYIVFPPEVDFSRQLGDRGVGRSVEDFADDDLEALEQEDDADETAQPDSSKVQDNANDANDTNEVNGAYEPLSTPASARDAQEVEHVVTVDEDIPMEDEPQDIENETIEQLNGKGVEDDHVEEEAPPPPPSKPTPTPRPTKTIAERMQDKGESAARTRIKPRPKGKPKVGPPKDRSATPEVRVTKRKSGEIEITPVKKRPRVSPDSSSSSSEGEIEVVESVVKKPKPKLVRRVTSRTESLIMDAVVVTPLRPAKESHVHASGDDEAVNTSPSRKPKKGILKTPSKQLFSDAESEQEESPSQKRPKKNVFIDDEAGQADDVESIIISPKRGKKKQVQVDDEYDEDVPVKAKPRKSATPSSKKGKEKETMELEDDEDIPTSKTKKITSKSTENERSKPRMNGKAKKITTPSESAEEEDETSPPPARAAAKARSKTSKRVSTPPASDVEDEEPRSPRRASTRAVGASSTSPSKSKKTSAKPVSSDDDEDRDMEPSSSKKKLPSKPRNSITTYSSASKPKPKSKTEEDEDVEEVEKPRSTRKEKPNGRSEPITTSSKPNNTNTPQRPVAVLLPGLNLSTRKSSSSSPNKNVTGPSLPRTDSIRVVAGERAATGSAAKGNTKLKGDTNAKTKPTTKPQPTRKPAPPAPAQSNSPAPTTTTDDEGTPAPALTAGGRVKRGAAARATQKLHDEIMPDVLNYQNEMRGAAGKGRHSLGSIPVPDGTGTQGGGKKRRSFGEGEGEGDKKRRRVEAAEEEDQEEEEEEEEEEEAPKLTKSVKAKAKHVDEPPSRPEAVSKGKARKANKTDDLDTSAGAGSRSGTIRLMTTQVTLSEDVVKTLTKLGVKSTTKPSECTHLIAPHLVRTEKFLCALAVAPFILNSKWAVDSAGASKLLGEYRVCLPGGLSALTEWFIPDERPYLLHDKTNERKFEFVLADAIAKAKQLKGTLFSKMVFYVTPKVPVDFKLLKNVVVAGGGQLSALCYLHGMGIVHRDIKPCNILVSVEDPQQLKIVDFAFAGHIDPDHCKRIVRDDAGVVGTLTWASIRSHEGYQLTRRDDLESLAYILLAFLRTGLPWRYYEGNYIFNAANQVLHKKRNWSGARLGRELPPCFGNFLDYARELSYDQIPDYRGWARTFNDLAESYNLDPNRPFDWTLESAVRIPRGGVLQDRSPTQAYLPVELGQIVYLQILARPTLEKLKTHRDPSYWHDPELSTNPLLQGMDLIPGIVVDLGPLGSHSVSTRWVKVLPIQRGKTPDLPIIEEKFARIVSKSSLKVNDYDIVLPDWPFEDTFCCGWPKPIKMSFFQAITAQEAERLAHDFSINVTFGLEDRLAILQHSSILAKPYPLTPQTVVKCGDLSTNWTTKEGWHDDIEKMCRMYFKKDRGVEWPWDESEKSCYEWESYLRDLSMWDNRQWEDRDRSLTFPEPTRADLRLKVFKTELIVEGHP
ncbi:hypothetical protein H0H93_005688 [Arthromyces matolae]|nr:hypothetical protein H0H93_005688 [Arthromyces matolae]